MAYKMTYDLEQLVEYLEVTAAGSEFMAKRSNDPLMRMATLIRVDEMKRITKIIKTGDFYD